RGSARRRSTRWSKRAGRRPPPASRRQMGCRAPSDSMAEPYDPRLHIDGAGDPVVLVPGLDGTGQLFYRQRPLLARSRKVAPYALRDSTSDMSTLVDDLAGVIEQVSPADKRAIVIGESFGGTLAMSLALARPDRVSALV